MQINCFRKIYLRYVQKKKKKMNLCTVYISAFLKYVIHKFQTNDKGFKDYTLIKSNNQSQKQFFQISIHKIHFF